MSKRIREKHAAFAPAYQLTILPPPSTRTSTVGESEGNPRADKDRSHFQIPRFLDRSDSSTEKYDRVREVALSGAQDSRESGGWLADGLQATPLDKRLCNCTSSGFPALLSSL